MLMYSTCLFCNRPLGDNEVIENFPVGRRLAYDASKGRLWVVCRRCERWNLSPLESRWEAIEECERAFSETRLRVSTDNIGLARLPEGLELVRLGNPLREEFAAWRYGDQFGRRRRRAIVVGAAAAAAGGAIIIGGAAAGITMGGGGYGFFHLFRWISNERVAVRLRDPDGERIRVQVKHLQQSRILPASNSQGWELHVRHAEGWRSGPSSNEETMVLEGEEAIRTAGRLMARVNRAGGSKNNVELAVRRIESAGHPDRYLRDLSAEVRRLYDEKAAQVGRRGRKSNVAGALNQIPKDARLAFEMATQEEAERAAMEGELTLLEAAWQQADEIAGIADNLLIPRETEEFIEREKRVGSHERTAAGESDHDTGDGPAQ